MGNLLACCLSQRGLTVGVPRVPPRLPRLPFLEGAGDTCADHTWRVAKTASALKQKSSARLCVAPSTCPVGAAVCLMSCHRRLVSAQRSQSGGLTIFFISMLGLYLAWGRGGYLCLLIYNNILDI